MHEKLIFKKPGYFLREIRRFDIKVNVSKTKRGRLLTPLPLKKVGGPAQRFL